MMKKKQVMRWIISCVYALLFFSTVSYATVNWHGGLITTDVNNEDIDIIGTNIIGETVVVTATTQDIIVSVVNGDSIISGTKINDTASHLRLVLDQGYKITFDLDNSLFFKGADGEDATGDLLVTIEGNGQVVFALGDGQTVCFGSTEDSAGTQVYVIMNEDAPPTLLFDRKNKASDEHVYIQIGQKSLMSYLSKWRNPALFAPNLDRGSIVFDPGNSINNIGRMVLRICDTGGIYVGGNTYKCKCWVCPGLDGIDLSDMRGLEAKFLVKNSVDGGQSSLLIENQNASYPDLYIDPFEEDSFDSERFGFILGPNGLIRIDDNSYIDYVGLTNDFCPTPNIPDEILFGREVCQMVKPRNASAFIVDGDPNGLINAKIELGDHSALYFKSGVSRYGQINELGTDGLFSFTVDNLAKSCGAGEMVFDIEGKLDVIGDGNGAINALEILSLEETFTGGSVLIDSNETIFPKRTFNKDCCEGYLSYNKAYWFINNRINLFNTWLVHTDQNHKVCESNDVCSEPSYVGGEKIKMCCDGSNLPKMAFYNSQFYVHTSAAFTGVDLFVPNLDEESGNETIFKFFNNGAEIDDGSGRNLILGTLVGACSCCCTLIDADAHLDVFQEVYTSTKWLVAPPQSLSLQVDFNNNTIIEGVPDTPVCDYYSIHTIFLGHSSNATIGGGSISGLESVPELNIQGNFFSFEARGGNCCSPENSTSTGQGGIFVDKNGRFTIEDQYRANIGTMVTKSDNGFIYLPKGKVFFDNRVGVADWRIDLAQNNIIIPEGAYITDYTLNWLLVTKDYGNYCPYQLCCVVPCGNCPGITAQMVTALPTVLGTVEQLQIKGSRISSPAHIMVDGGRVRELTFLTDYNSAEAPTAVVAVQNEGRVGLGSTHKNVDALHSSIFLGANGITIIANGNGWVDINEDVIVNDVCHILRGPDFVPEEDAEEVILKINSDSGKKIRVLENGILDLSSFTSAEQVVEFVGDINLILEPGSKVRLGGGILRFSDEAEIRCTNITDLSVFDDYELFPTAPITDPFRVDFIGTGTVEFNECSSMSIEEWAYVSITADDECATGTTNITIWLRDSSKFAIGAVCQDEGGVLQIGDTKQENGTSVKFALIIDGDEAEFSIGKNSFLGLAVGIVDNRSEFVSEWQVANLFHVDGIDIEVRNGTFRHNQIFATDEPDASLISIGKVWVDPADTEQGEKSVFRFGFDPKRATILGGGNMYLADLPYIPAGDLFDYAFFLPDFPQVLDEKTSIANIMASKDLIYNLTAIPITEGYNPAYYHVSKKYFETLDIFGFPIYLFTSSITATQLFNYLEVVDLLVLLGVTLTQGQRGTVFGTVGPEDKNMSNIGYVDEGIIYRFPTEFIAKPRFVVRDHEYSLRLGAVSLILQQLSVSERLVYKISELP